MTNKSSLSQTVFHTAQIHTASCLDSSKQIFCIYNAINQSDDKGINYESLKERACAISANEFGSNYFFSPVPIATFMKEAMNNGEIMRSDDGYVLSTKGQRVLNFISNQEITPYKTLMQDERNAIETTKRLIKSMLVPNNG